MNTSSSNKKREGTTKLILGLFFISSVIILLMSVVIRIQMNRSGAMLTKATQHHLETSSQLLAKFVSAEELELYQTTADTETGEYQKLKQRLITFARDNNLLYAYYWRSYGNNKMQYIVDNDLDPDQKVGPWDIEDMVEIIARTALSGDIGITDLTKIIPTWDGYITAYAPVYDKEGKLSCVAGVDISHKNLFIQRRDAQRMTFLLLIAIPLSVVSGILNMFLYSNRARQLEETNVKLVYERDIMQTLKDNISQGVFLMDKDFKILSQYSLPLVSIFSYHDDELEGKSFLDIISGSFDAKKIQIMKTYFSMVFDKTKSAKVLDSSNPIYEFEYKIGNIKKILSTKFFLIEQRNKESVIIGIIQDITKEKQFEVELQTQKAAQELEMKNMFDVIQIDPMVFQDFIEDTEANFNYINTILKDRTLTEKQVVTKFFQNVHAIKSNSLILGLETFGNKLHLLEDEIKRILAQEIISAEDILSLAMGLEVIMQEKDSYIVIVKRIEKFQNSNQFDSVLVHSLTKAIERVTNETKKKVKLEAGEIDLAIMGSRLRKPIKDILFQCLRNAIYHGIESEDERIKKNKNPQGLLSFSIKTVDGKAEVTFSDDGRGLDWEKIKTKYLEQNPNSQDTSKKVLLSMIFKPEFSTSDQVSQVAGRGVGLSYVKDLVKENKGVISVNSTESGLTFKFIFPILA